MANVDRRATAAHGRWRTLLGSVVLVGLTGACGPEADEPPSVQGRAVATYSDPSVYRVGRAELRRLTDRLDPDSPQRVSLADGHVSRTEVEQAWEGYAHCMRRVGFVVTTSAWDPVTGTSRVFTFARDGATRSAPGSPTRSATPTTTTITTPRTTATTSSGSPSTIDAMTSTEDERVDACEEAYWFPVSAIYAADTPPRMTNELTRAVVACMAGRGYDVRGSRDFGAVVGAVGGRASGRRVEAGRECLSGALRRLYPDLPYYPRP